MQISICVTKLTLSFEDRASALIGHRLVMHSPICICVIADEELLPLEFWAFVVCGHQIPSLGESKHVNEDFSQWFFHSTSRESALVLEYNFINRLLTGQKRMVVIWLSIFGMPSDVKYCNWNLVPGFEEHLGCWYHLIIMRGRNFGPYLVYTPTNLFSGFIKVFGFCLRWGSATALFWLDRGGCDLAD